MEASLTAERRHMLTTNFVFGPSGSLPSTERVTVDTFPVDVTGRYHFTNRSRFQPYVSAGLRYVHAPDNIHEPIILTQPLTPISSIVVKPYANRTSAEVGGGLSFRMTDHVSLQGDVKRLLRNDSAPFDPLTRTSFGLSFKF